MRVKNLIWVFLLGFFVFGSIDADAQRRNAYGKRKKRNRSISKYKGGSVGGRFRPYEFAGVNLNALNYFGDLAPLSRAASTDVSFTRPGFGFNFGYKFHHSFALRAGLNWGRLQASDYSSLANAESGVSNQGRYLRNLSFRNDIYELQLGAEIYLLPNYGGPNVRRDFNAYIFAGVALFWHNPKGQVPEYDYQTDGSEAPKAGQWVSLRELGTEGQYILHQIYSDLDDVNTVEEMEAFNQKYGEGILNALDKITEAQIRDGYDMDKTFYARGRTTYSRLQVSIPVGVGVTAKIPKTPFNVGLEVGYRFLFTDYIDDVSGYYMDLGAFETYMGDNGTLARIMSDRSAEAIEVDSGNERKNIDVSTNTFSDGNSYSFSSPQGGGNPGNRRGDPNNNDMYIVTSIKVTYILGGGVRRNGKFR